MTMTKRSPDADSGVIIEPLYQAGPPTPIVIEILDEDAPEDRYTRLRQLGWDMELLRTASVLVVGAGALGNEVLKNLALLGVGRILVVDMDRIEDTNLARSALFRPGDVGRLKAEVAAERVRDLNPDVAIMACTGTVQEAIGLGVYRRMDLVLGCLDNRQARLDVNRACWCTATPYIDAGLHEINGDVQVFIPPVTACYGCTISAEARKQATDRHACLRVKIGESKPTIPTAPTIASMMAGWQTQIAVKHLHGLRIPAGERLALYGLPDEIERYRLSSNPACRDHAPENLIDEGTIVELPCRAAEITLAAFVALAQEAAHLGPEGSVAFDFDVVLTGFCNTCGVGKSFFRRQTALTLAEITCDQCGDVLDLETEYQFDGTEPYADRTLAELGVPPLHLVTGKNWQRRHYVALELSGDHADFFAGSAAHNPKQLAVRIAGVTGADRTCWLPKRLTTADILLWQAEAWGLPDPPVGSSYRLRNQTQGFAYGPSETLEGRGTRPGARLTIETVLEVVAPAQGTLEVVLPARD